MIGWALLRRAPCTTFRPTPPQPYTAALSPGRMLTVLRAAPTPVVTPQPTRAATSKEMSSSIGTTLSTGAMVCSVNVDSTLNCRAGLPSIRNRVEPSGMVPSRQRQKVSHKPVSPCWQ